MSVLWAKKILYYKIVKEKQRLLYYIQTYVKKIQHNRKTFSCMLNIGKYSPKAVKKNLYCGDIKFQNSYRLSYLINSLSVLRDADVDGITMTILLCVRKRVPILLEIYLHFIVILIIPYKSVLILQ